MNNKLEEFGVIDLKPFNKLITTSEITEPVFVQDL